MKPETVKEMLESPVMVEFVRFIAHVVMELDSLEGIELTNPEEATIEMKARQLAGEKLKKILTPFGLAPKKNVRDNKKKNLYAM